MRFLRPFLSLTTLEKRRNISIGEKSLVSNIAEDVQYQNEWRKHVAGMAEAHPPLWALLYHPSGQRDVG
jgi:hypothetical protein